MIETAPNKRSRAPATTGRIGGPALQAESGKTGGARAGLPLRWSATEFAPHKSWWWYLIAGLGLLWGAALFTALGNWLGGLVTLLAGVALFRWYLPKPRVFDYQLTDTELNINSVIVRSLERYRSFTIEEIRPDKHQAPVEVIVLIPKATFGRGLDLYLPSDEATTLRIIQAINRSLILRDNSRVHERAPTRQTEPDPKELA